MSDVLVEDSEVPAVVRWMVDAAREQGGTLVDIDWDPAGGQAGGGRLRMVFEKKATGERFAHSGWGRVRDGRFRFDMAHAGPVSP